MVTAFLSLNIIVWQKNSYMLSKIIKNGESEYGVYPRPRKKFSKNAAAP